MARPQATPMDTALNNFLKSWAIWCDGDIGLQGGGKSMLAKLIDGKGEILFGNSGGSSEPQDMIEARIEGIVVGMAGKQMDMADVLRMEFEAGWWMVCHRRKIRHYDPRGLDQMKRAHALGMSLRTYRRRLTEARAVIETRLTSAP